MNCIKGIISFSLFLLALSFMNDEVAAATVKGDSLANMYGYIGCELKNRSSCIEVEVNNFTDDDITKILSSEGLKTYTAADGTDYDYDVFNIRTLRYACNVVTANEQTTYKIKLFPSYKESRKETAYVKAKIIEILGNNNSVYALSDSEKCAWIYNYIINNVYYDTTLVNGTAYAALTYGSAICGGYSSLFYTFADALGLNCRIAYGSGFGIYHAWNLVKLNGAYYCVDVTMGDAPDSQLDNFLIALNNFGGHSIETGYTSSFNFAESNYAQ